MTYKTKKNTGRKLETVLFFAAFAVFVLLFLYSARVGSGRNRNRCSRCPVDGII